MLFPRCIHRRLCCVLLHEFHTTRPYLRGSLKLFQMDPFTAREIIESRSRSKSDSQKTKAPRTGKQREEKSDRIRGFSDSDNLSLRMRRRNRRFRRPRTVGGADVKGPSFSMVLIGRLSSPSTPTERGAHLGASENAGGSSCPFHAVLFHLLHSTVRSQRR
jgi:hypothetical protein